MGHVTEENQEVRMDYATEEKKFIWRVKDAVRSDEKAAHLKAAAVARAMGQ
jgi:hypothetical protein